jgi:hypothetical protein
MTFQYRLYLNETIDITREYCSYDGYVPGAHMKLAYAGEVTVADGDGKRQYALESLFETFNINQPKDYKDRSLSVGDVVVLNDGTNDIVYGCMGVGWERVAGWVPTTKNPNWIDRDEYLRRRRALSVPGERFSGLFPV